MTELQSRSGLQNSDLHDTDELLSEFREQLQRSRTNKEDDRLRYEFLADPRAAGLDGARAHIELMVGLRRNSRNLHRLYDALFGRQGARVLHDYQGALTIETSALRKDDEPKLTPDEESTRKVEFYAQIVGYFAGCETFPGHLELRRQLLADPPLVDGQLPENWQLLIRMLCLASPMRLIVDRIFPEPLMKVVRRQARKRARKQG